MSDRNSVRPMALRHTASLIARNYGDKGAVIITLGSEGIRIGTDGLTTAELREALCTAMHYTFDGVDHG